MKKLAITGGTGFIGSQIVQQMQAMGYEVVLISKADINSETNMLKQKLKNASLVINLAGAPIIKDWTEPYKKYLYSSRVHTTTNLVYAIDRESTKLFISASAVGIYGNNGPQTENNFTYADDFLGKICRDWETEALYLSDSVRTIIFRFGVVLGNGGALQKMLPLFRRNLGGVIAGGRQAYSWVHIQDVLGAISYVLQHPDCNGIYNLTSPHPVDNRTFTKTLALALHKKAFLPVPAFALKVLYGEGATALINGQTALPEHLLNDGYQFQFPELKEAIEDLV